MADLKLSKTKLADHHAKLKGEDIETHIADVPRAIGISWLFNLMDDMFWTYTVTVEEDRIGVYVGASLVGGLYTNEDHTCVAYLEVVI